MRPAALVLAALIPSQPPAARPAYVLEIQPVKRVEAVLTHKVKAPQLKASEWVVFAPQLPVLAGQSEVSSKMEPAGKAAKELSPLGRPILFARVPARTQDLETGITVQVHYSALLHSRKLVPLKPGAQPPKVAPLSNGERKTYLAATAMVDHDDAAFRQWLKDAKLQRARGEDEVSYARRVVKYVRNNFRYGYHAQLDRRPVATCRQGISDCGGLSVLFIATMRANGVPARLLVGRWAESAKKGKTIDGAEWFQEHAQAEFYLKGVGWVPVDPSMTVLKDRSEDGLEHFGNSRGDFLVMHLEDDLLLDTVHFGRKNLVLMQAVTVWATGQGSVEGMTKREDWQVKEKPVK